MNLRKSKPNLQDLFVYKSHVNISLISMSSSDLENIKKRLAFVEQELQELKELIKQKEAQNEQVPKKPSFPSYSKQLKENFESILGANLISKTGFLAIILAFIWFLSFAFENYWINESGRIYLALLGGYFFWGLSFYFYKQNYEKLSPTMLGTGITVVLLGIFSAYRFYDFLSIEETFINLLLLSCVTLFFSKLAHSQVLYVFGILVIFLNPILISTGENSYKFLFSYLAFWNLVHVWFGKSFYWRFSSLFIPILNISLYGVWFNQNIQQSSFFVPFVFLFLSFIGILVREIYFQAQFSLKPHWATGLSLVIGTIGYASLMQITVDHFYPQFTPVLLICLAILPLILIMYPVFKTKFESIYEISGIVILISSYLFVVSTLSIWQEEWRNLPLLLISAGIVMLGAKQNKKSLYYIGCGVLVLTLLSFVFSLSTIMGTGVFLFNTRFLIYIFGVVTLLFLYKLISQTTELPFTNLYFLAGIFLLVFGTLVEVHYFVSSHSYRNLGYSYVFAFYSTVFLGYGFIKNSLQMRKLAFGLLVILITKFYLYDIWSLSLIVKIISGFSLGLGLVLVGIFYEKFKTKLLGENE